MIPLSMSDQNCVETFTASRKRLLHGCLCRLRLNYSEFTNSSNRTRLPYHSSKDTSFSLILRRGNMGLASRRDQHLCLRIQFLRPWSGWIPGMRNTSPHKARPCPPPPLTWVIWAAWAACIISTAALPACRWRCSRRSRVCQRQDLRQWRQGRDGNSFYCRDNSLLLGEIFFIPRIQTRKNCSRIKK